MGTQQIVYGYIELEKHTETEPILLAYKFDDVYPFINIFSHSSDGYQCSMMSFAGSYKSLNDEWAEWEAKFERMLMQLHATSAHVHLVDELDGEMRCVSYLREFVDGAGGGPACSKWVKWYIKSSQSFSEEVPVNPAA